MLDTLVCLFLTVCYSILVQLLHLLLNLHLIFIEGSSFMIGRALTSLLWGMMADKYGRKPVIMIGTMTLWVSSESISIQPPIYIYGTWPCYIASHFGLIHQFDLNLSGLYSIHFLVLV